MTAYPISACTFADSNAISRNNISAFWEDPTWILSWNHTTLEQHIIQVNKRIPRNLINNRVTVRHQKATDPETGRLLGYARWILPLSHAIIADGKPAWPEAMGPEVGIEEEAGIRRIAATAIWNPNKEADKLDVPFSEIKKGILKKKPYLCLDYVAVHPENKGKGVATALVKSGMREAELMGLDIFILAFKAGLGVYKRLGFHVEKELIQDDSMCGGKGEYGAYFMTYAQSPGSVA